MQLQNIRSQIARLKAQLPPPRGKDPVVVLAAKGPRPADDPADDGFLHWYYENESELEELRAKFDREYGPSARGPNDEPCLFVEIAEVARRPDAEDIGRLIEGTP